MTDTQRSRYFTVGWQVSCRSEDCTEEPDERFYDTWQNPDQGASMARAAQAHANRTGHETLIEKHSQRIVSPKERAL